jgi:hypothetical protein
VNVIPPNFRAAFSGGRERWLIWLLCLAAGWRVFIYSAAFPFFNNVDEQSHFDLVVKYAQGQPPHGLEKFSTESARYFVMCGSPEYLLTPDRFPGGKFPSPPWTRPVENIAGQLLPQIAQWESKTNHESSQPPLYYAAAGLWMRLGQSCGQQDCFLLYWIRFLNVPLAALLVWLGFIASKIIFPEQIFPRLAVPVLLAFIPQDVFYSIQNDVLSPLCFGAAFICVLRWWQTDTPTPRLALATALCLVASCLVKTTNLPAVAVAGAALLFNARRLATTGKLRNSLAAIALLFFCSAIPIAVWLLWNRHTSGDFTGSAAKIELLGWKPKPVTAWLHHPLFTPRGWWVFGSELMASFWRGEFVWLGQRLASATADLFYWISSALFLTLGALSLIPRTSATELRRALWFGFWCCVASVAFLGLLSVAYDFGNCVYPSREHPYFTSGRLLGSVLIPFMLLYARGLDRILGWIKNDRPKFFVLAGIVLFVTLSEIVVNRAAFSSPYNWFHLWLAGS